MAICFGIKWVGNCCTLLYKKGVLQSDWTRRNATLIETEKEHPEGGVGRLN